MKSSLPILFAVLLAMPAAAQPLAYKLPAGAVYSAHLDAKFSVKTLGFIPVPGQGRAFQLDIVARAQGDGIAFDVDRRDGAKLRKHRFTGALGAHGPLAFDASQFPFGGSDPEPRGVAMGIVMALPTFNGVEPRPRLTWARQINIPVPPNQYTKVTQVTVNATYTVKKVLADRVEIEVNAEGGGQGPGPQDGSLNLSYDGTFQLDRRTGMPLEASLSGCCAKADATAALARVAFSLSYRGDPVRVPVAAAGTPVSLLGVSGP